MSATFPGVIQPSEHVNQVVTLGIKSSFHGGVVYRHPGHPAMCDVSGDYYEMGLQYGVLLRPEILSAVESQEKIVRWIAADSGAPLDALVEGLEAQTARTASLLPKRYLDELQGIADGSGVPVETVRMIALEYDAMMAKACTGVLMRTSDGKVIHARNNDVTSFGGEEVVKQTVVVRHRAPGKHAVTSIDFVCYLGVESGYNDQGMTFSEETLAAREHNPAGFSLAYLIRMILEDCATFSEMYPYFDKYPRIGAYGCIWGQMRERRGALIELLPNAWGEIPLTGPILWDLNHVYHPLLRADENPMAFISAGNRDREQVARCFPRKPSYTLKDAVGFMRAQEGPGGENYAWFGAKWPICNSAGQQMHMFDPDGDGFYLGLGVCYCARENVYHFHNDFSRAPDLFMPAVPMPAVVSEAGRIDNLLLTKAEKLQEYIKLANRFPRDAQAQFVVARRALLARDADRLAEYAERAYALDGSVLDYRLYAGYAAYRRKQTDKAIALLESVPGSELNPEPELVRLTLLERAWSGQSAAKAAAYASTREALLSVLDAQAVYNAQFKPLIDALDA
jgi:hypothetical protein